MRHELAKELGLDPARGEVRYLAEIAEAVWVDTTQAAELPLALLSRDCILPLLSRL